MEHTEGIPTESGTADRSPKKRPTIYDIAERLNLSPSTVSRALGKPGRINAKTEAKIRDTARELGYRINPMARALPTGLTGTYAVVLPDITNPVHFELIRGIEEVARTRGFTLVVAESQGSAESEWETISSLQLAVDGVLVVASRLDDERLADLARVTPIVAANHASASLPSVFPDAASSLTAIMDHLEGLGHRSVAYLSPLDIGVTRVKWDLLFDIAIAKKMSIVEISIAGPTVDAGSDALSRILASRATAVVAYNDLVAHGVLRAARIAGVEVPEAFSLVGFDDIFSAELASPPLTTIRTPLHEIGAQAMALLVDPLTNREVTRFTLPTELVVRESTAAPRA